MRKEKLRRRLALCILETLPAHKLTLPNVKRYVTSDLMTTYTIRRETKVSDVDYSTAIDMVKKAVRSKPAPFRYASKDSPWGIKRKEHFLHTPLADLV